MKINKCLLLTLICVAIIPLHKAKAVSTISHELGSFYAGKDIEAIDLDSDGDIDIVGCAYSTGGGLYWFENDGSSNFEKKDIDTSFDYDYMHLDAGDIDEDGDIDVVIADRNGYVYLYTNDGSENFSRTTVGSGLYNVQRVKMGDLDDDGDTDILAPNGEYTDTWVGNIRWYENNGSESFTARYIDTDQSDAYVADFGDMDGDGDTDVIGAGNTWGNVSKYISDGGNPPSFSETYVGSGSNDLEVIDYDEDGDLDFFTVSAYSLKWYENDGDASFTSHTILDSDSLEGADALYIGDIDADGDYDFLIPEDNDGVAWWENDGNLNLTKHDVGAYSHSTTIFGAIANLDGTGNQEIITFGADDTLYWYEVVMDETSPELADSSPLFPADDATSFDIDANLVITFNEDVATSTGNFYIKKTSDDSVFETFNVASSTVTASGTTAFVLNPRSNFASETSYYVNIDATAIDDTSGNSFAGISDTSTWNFTSADSINPSLSTLSPADNATDVAVSSNLVMTFDEAVDAESGNIVLYKTSDDSTVETFDVTSDITGSGTTEITINPASDLAYETEYYLIVPATAFDDTAGNSYAGITASTTWSFTMVDTPTCATVANAATYNSWPTCGVATCSDDYTLTDGACVQNGSSAPPAPAPTVGVGDTTTIVSMGTTGDAGVVTRAGTNIATYINTPTHFQTTVSNQGSYVVQKHTIEIIDFDLFYNVLTLQINSEPQILTLKLDEETTVDLDGDLVKDIKIKFEDVFINRAELTVLSLLSDSDPLEEKEEVKVKEKAVAEEFSQNEEVINTYEFTRDLKLGMSGEDVIKLQKFLNSQGSIERGAGSPGE